MGFGVWSWVTHCPLATRTVSGGRGWRPLAQVVVLSCLMDKFVPVLSQKVLLGKCRGQWALRTTGLRCMDREGCKGDRQVAGGQGSGGLWSLTQKL